MYVYGCKSHSGQVSIATSKNHLRNKNHLPNTQATVDLLTFTEEILNGKLHFLCSVCVCINRDIVIPRD